MTYLDELQKEFDFICKKYPKFMQLRPKAKSAHMAKLRRYIGRVRGEHVPMQKWMAGQFEGRASRTPWKPKGIPYIEKRLRPKW